MPAKFEDETRRKTQCVMVRLTEAELALIDEAIAETGETDRAIFFRDAGVARARGAEVVLPKGASTQLKQLAGAVGLWKALGTLYSALGGGGVQKT